MVEVHRTEWHQCTSSQLLPQRLQVQLQVQPRRRHEPRPEADSNGMNILDRVSSNSSSFAGHGVGIRFGYRNRMSSQALLLGGRTRMASPELW